MTSDLSKIRLKFEEKFAHSLKCINQKQINLIFTSSIILVSMYLTLIVWLHRDLMHPLQEDHMEDLNLTDTLDNPKIWTTSIFEYDQSIMSLFILWASALIFGFFVDIFKLPPLLGMLLVGVAFRNIPFIANSLLIEKSWEAILRQIAFVLILIRCGVGLNAAVLKKSLVLCGLLGMLSCIVEVGAIIFATHFIMGIPIASVIAFSFVLAANSPAVTVPTMIFLQEQERGTEKGIPTIILASASLDNLFCITAFYMASSLTFASNENIWATITNVPIQLIAAIIGGAVIGYILRCLPKPEASNVHFSRSMIMLALSFALYYGTQCFDWRIAGPIAILLFSIVSSAKWKDDNCKKVRPVEQAFRMLWNLVFQPFLFALIGLLFDLSQINVQLFLTALSIIVIGLIIRIISVFAISYVSNFDFKEKLFVSFGFFPKATVQAALAPALFDYCSDDKICSSYANKLLQTCILSILITAPIGQLLLQVLGRILLTPKSPDLTEIDSTQDSDRSENSNSVEMNSMTTNGENSMASTNETSHKTVIIVN